MRLLKTTSCKQLSRRCEFDSSQSQFVCLDMFVNGLAVLCRSGWFHSASCLSRGRTQVLIPKTRRCRNQQSMAFQTPIANTDVYKGSFFPKTIKDWNALPDSLISSAEDAEDCVAKVTSLVRARD